METIQIILSGSAYHARTKGEIHKLLQGLEVTVLGDGSFTGFLVENTTKVEVRKRLEKYTNYEDVQIETI